jgi:hypothetical protein
MASDALEACSLTNVSSDRLLGVMDMPARGVIDLLPRSQGVLDLHL